MAANPYDQASRYAAKLDPLGFLRWLVDRLAPAVTFDGWLDTRTIPFPAHAWRRGNGYDGTMEGAGAGGTR